MLKSSTFRHSYLTAGGKLLQRLVAAPPRCWLLLTCDRQRHLVAVITPPNAVSVPLPAPCTCNLYIKRIFITCMTRIFFAVLPIHTPSPHNCRVFRTMVRACPMGTILCFGAPTHLPSFDPTPNLRSIDWPPVIVPIISLVFHYMHNQNVLIQPSSPPSSLPCFSLPRTRCLPVSTSSRAGAEYLPTLRRSRTVRWAQLVVVSCASRPV